MEKDSGRYRARGEEGGEEGSLKGQKERVCVREKRERAWKRVGGNTERVGRCADERWRKNGG